MGPLIALLGLAGLFLLWAFFMFPPEHAKPYQLGVFNWSCVAVCAMICGAWVLNVRAMLSSPVNEKYIPLFAYGGGFAIEIVLIGILFLLRNFWIFKPPRRPGGFF